MKILFVAVGAIIVGGIASVLGVQSGVFRGIATAIGVGCGLLLYGLIKEKQERKLIEYEVEQERITYEQEPSKSNLKPCLNCGQQFERKYNHCWKCGAKRGAVQPVRSDKKEITEVKSPLVNNIAKNEVSKSESSENMKRSQSRTIFIALLTICGMLLWPPWKVGTSGRSIGYHLFFRAAPDGRSAAYIDWSRLGLQFLIVGVLTTAVIVLFKSKQHSKS
jgi:hypothetical protein